MVDSNLQRSTILPSEKAFAYKMRLDAMKRQGERSDLTSRPVGTKFRSDAELSEMVPDSARQIQRFIRLTNLETPLLNMVDDARIAMRPAVELSYLTQEEQTVLAEEIEFADATPSLAQAIKMREFSKNGKLTPEVVQSILSEEKPNQREKISFRADHIRKFIPTAISKQDTEKYVLQALEYYRSVGEKQHMRDGEAR